MEIEQVGDAVVQEKERAHLKEAIARNDAARVEPQVWRADPTDTREKVEALFLQQHGMRAMKADFEAIAAQAMTQTEAMAASHREATAAASRERATHLSALSASRIASFQAIADVPDLGGDRQSILLQTPFEISLVGAALTDHSIVPGASYARFKFVLGKGRNEKARAHFSYIWQNPTNRYALINAHGYLILDGYLEVRLNGGFWPGGRSARISAVPGMSLHDWGQEPLLPSAQTYLAAAASLDEEDKSFMAVGAIVSTDVFRGFDLGLSNYIVKPHGTIGLVIAVNLAGSTGDSDGRVEADFADGNHRAASPGVLLQVIS